ncbi:hypothetical protein Tco_1184308 [Tanacetum coccineum]
MSINTDIALYLASKTGYHNAFRLFCDQLTRSYISQELAYNQMSPRKSDNRIAPHLLQMLLVQLKNPSDTIVRSIGCNNRPFKTHELFLALLFDPAGLSQSTLYVMVQPASAESIEYPKELAHRNCSLVETVYRGDREAHGEPALIQWELRATTSAIWSELTSGRLEINTEVSGVITSSNSG